jgi:hypothetical protein
MPPPVVPIHFVEPVAQPDGASAWLVRTREMLEGPLAERGITVTCGAELLPDAINLAGAASLSRLWRPYFRSFMVALRSDATEVNQCDWEIVASGLALPRSTRSMLAPWTSAAALSRHPSRANRVTNLAFASACDGASRWQRAHAEIGQLARLGISCRIENAPFADLSAIDVLVADCAELRQAGGGWSSPLVAAWRAGVPALLVEGEQEQFERTSPLDYLPLSSAEQLVETVAQLQSHPQLYEAMRQRGAERERELRDQRLTRHWLKLLIGEISPVAEALLRQRRARPMRALSLQARRWLVQHSRRRTSPTGPATAR